MSVVLGREERRGTPTGQGVEFLREVYSHYFVKVLLRSPMV